MLPSQILRLTESGTPAPTQIDFDLAVAEFGATVEYRLQETVEKSDGKKGKKLFPKYPGGLKDILHLTDHGTASASGSTQRYQDPLSHPAFRGKEIKTE